MLTSPKPISIPFLTEPGQRWLREQLAIEAVSAFTRTRMREDGFFRRIMPPLEMSNDELDRAVPTDRPVRVVDAEERDDDSPAAISVPFGRLPTAGVIIGPRYEVQLYAVPREEANG